MAKDKKKTAKRKVGRPKRKFTEAQVRRMGDLAFAGCQNNTIATIMEIPKETLVVNFGHLLTKKRCERKLKLRREQNKATKAGVPSMLIWMGKQTLEQVDKAELSGPGGGPLQITMVDYGKIDDSKPTV
ncbi:MAG TPA: hypothetical protein ENH62_10520 [Marinobacter sp.]|uniref:Uncharacterized protein n=1 Tax=marine sediment metagenome TaxID=412755 RepID=A0A0F9ITI0_9ZZZZ|nr:hypothetical protein [Marinobacter sp.]